MFGEKGFSAESLTFDYDSVTSIKWEYEIHKLLPQMTEEHFPNITIYIKNSHDPIKVQRNAWSRFWTAGVNKVQADQMISTYVELSKRTFSARLARYTDQISASGGFMYDGKRFMTDGNVFSASGKLLMNIRERSLARRYDRVVCRRPGKRVDLMGSTIKTLFDRDVFFSLLDGLYRVRWDSAS